MSLKVIREQVLKFLSQSTPSVLAVKGEWGVGKTYGWEVLLKEAKELNMISGKRYSYVSLFGISSLEQFKLTIFENTIQQNYIGHEPNLQSLGTNTLDMMKQFARGSWTKGIRNSSYVKSFVPALEVFSFMSVTETIICIDDLERKGSGLDLKDVLGLVSFLKEKKKCKIVLLLNAGSDEVADYEKYKEKVIDVEIEFSPTPEESAKLAYNGLKSYHAELSIFTVSLGIKNIRVLTKIEKYIDIVIDLIKDTEVEMLSQLLHTTSLFSLSYYCAGYDSDIPTLEYIESIKGINNVKDDNLTGKESHWKNLLRSYQFNDFNELDRMIAFLVRSGYVDRDAFINAVSVVNNKLVSDKKNGKYRRAWDNFHNSFNDNQEAVVEDLYDAFINNAHNLNSAELETLVDVLRELGLTNKASELIDEFIDAKKDDIESLNPSGMHIFHIIKDVEILEKFRSAYPDNKYKRSIKDVLDKISGKNGWSENDEITLSESSVEDFYDYFKSLDGPELIQHVATCLNFGGYTNPRERLTLISEKAKSALRIISSESKLNEIRMKKFDL